MSNHHSTKNLPSRNGHALPGPTRRQLRLVDLVLDAGTQVRAVNESVVSEYAEALDVPPGAKIAPDLPPIDVVYDGEHYWPFDGYHRIAGYRKKGRSRIPATVRPGTLRDAILLAVGANATHGLRRSDDDKSSAVQLLLIDREWAKNSDRWIAEACKVSHPFVAKLRRQLETLPVDPAGRRVGRDGKSRPATRSPGPSAPAAEDDDNWSDTAPEGAGDAWEPGEDRPPTATPANPPATAKPRSPAKPEPRLDPAGVEVPDNLRDLFDPWLKDSAEKARAMVSSIDRLKHVLAGKSNHYKRLKAGTMAGCLDAAKGELETFQSHAQQGILEFVCPTCRGDAEKRKQCVDCLHVGLVERWRYQELVEDRRLNAAAERRKAAAAK